MPDPTFLEQIQEAVDRGQVVVIPAPAVVTPQRDIGAALAAALSLAFGLGRGEARILGYLVTYGFASTNELCVSLPATTARCRCSMQAAAETETVRDLNPHIA